MKIRVSVADPQQVLGEDLRIDWEGTYIIEVSDSLTLAEAQQVAVDACKEQLGIPPCAPVTVRAVTGLTPVRPSS